MAKEDISFNGKSKDVYERIVRIETKIEAGRENDIEIKNDIKHIKEALVPLALKVNTNENLIQKHESIIKNTGRVLLALLTTGLLALIAML